MVIAFALRLAFGTPFSCEKVDSVLATLTSSPHSHASFAENHHVDAVVDGASLRNQSGLGTQLDLDSSPPPDLP